MELKLERRGGIASAAATNSFYQDLEDQLYSDNDSETGVKKQIKNRLRIGLVPNKPGTNLDGTDVYLHGTDV